MIVIGLEEEDRRDQWIQDAESVSVVVTLIIEGGPVVPLERKWALKSLIP